ncbi:hypothetical protein [Bounagaea algeriensis]
MSKIFMSTAFAAAFLVVSGCTAGQPPPADHAPGATETPTEVRNWGETVDNEQGLFFSAAQPRWVQDAAGRPVLQVTTTVTNHGDLELADVGVRTYGTDRGPATVQLSSRGENEASLVPGETTRDTTSLHVPEGARNLRVVMAQGTAPTARPPAVNIHFTGSIPPPPAGGDPNTHGASATATTDGGETEASGDSGVASSG